MKNGLLLLAIARAASAQCSMCRTALSAQAEYAAVLNTAILILLFPAVFLFCAIGIFTIRCARETRSATVAADSPADIEST